MKFTKMPANHRLILGFVLVWIMGAIGSGWYFLSDFDNGETVKKVGIAQWVSNKEYTENVKGFKDGLAEQGYSEGDNVFFLIENPEAEREKQREIMGYFIEKEVDLVYSLTTPGTLIAKKMITDRPIVFSIVTFPVEAGVTDSLESSGNNLVGTRNYIPIERQYNQFERIFPHNIKKIAFAHRKGELNSVIQYKRMKLFLAEKEVEVIDIAATDLDDLRNQLKGIIGEMDALYSACDTLIQSGGEEMVINFSILHQKPNFTCNKDGVLKGALMGNVADFYTIGKMAGNKAGLIFKGASPSSLPTESTDEDYLLINNKTAVKIGLEIPQDILNEAEEIIW